LSSKSSYQDLPEEERQKIKDLLFILEKFNVSESAYRELTVFCDGLPRTEILIFILSVSGFTFNLMYRIISLSRLTYTPGIFPGILSK
jgi:hypothetical protein